jgi:hypothetical protein
MAADLSRLGPLFQKLSEAAKEIADVFNGASGAGGGKRSIPETAFDAEGKPTKRKKEKRAPRPPTAFNLFMKKAVAEVKETSPGMNPKQIFAQCASKWKDSPDNPKAGLGTLAIAGDEGIGKEVEDKTETQKAPKNKEDKTPKKSKKDKVVVAV